MNSPSNIHHKNGSPPLHKIGAITFLRKKKAFVNINQASLTMRTAWQCYPCFVLIFTGKV